jgi:hypothetical protein
MNGLTNAASAESPTCNDLPRAATPNPAQPPPPHKISSHLTSSRLARHAGFPIDPVCIETEEGRREYQRLQQQLYEWGLPLRRRLLSTYGAFFALVERGQGKEGRGGAAA